MKRIAVVEDEVYMREELCDMLQKDGYLVEAITEFEDAARLLAALRPDLVILDLNLPEISGFQICQELKNKTAIPVLVLTSRDQVKDELQAFQLGADEYLTKPCRKDRLLARVSNILKRYEGRTNLIAVSYTHLRAHETDSYLVCRLLLEKKKSNRISIFRILLNKTV